MLIKLRRQCATRGILALASLFEIFYRFRWIYRRSLPGEVTDAEPTTAAKPATVTGFPKQREGSDWILRDTCAGTI
jgi:hypothetical protein